MWYSAEAMENEPTIKDVLRAVESLSTRIGSVEHSLGERIDVSQESIQGLATHMDEAFAKVHAEMATKEDLRASERRTMDFVDRKIEGVNAKIVTLARTLEKKHVITAAETTDVIRA